MTTVGTCGTGVSAPPARSRSARTAPSAAESHPWTLSSYTPGRKRSAMATGPGGRSVVSPPPLAPPGAPAAPLAGRGSALRPFARLGLRGGSLGCSSSKPRGMGSAVSAVVSSGARLRREAKAGGVVRASSMRARIEAVSAGPSLTRPPVTLARATGVSAACSLLAAASRSMSAIATFMPL
eukprot:512125-Pleurochrysis_carterae.AAC.1